MPHGRTRRYRAARRVSRSKGLVVSGPNRGGEAACDGLDSFRDVQARIESGLSKTLMNCSRGARQTTDRNCRLPRRLPPSLDIYNLFASSIARDGCGMTVRQSARQTQSASLQTTSNDKLVGVVPDQSDSQICRLDHPCCNRSRHPATIRKFIAGS